MVEDVVRLNEHFDKDEDGLWVTYKDYKKLLDKIKELQDEAFTASEYASYLEGLISG